MLGLSEGLRREARRALVERVATLLGPLANREFTEAADRAAGEAATLLAPVLQSARFEGVVAVAVYGHEGGLIRAFPESFVFAELPTRDFATLLVHPTLSRFDAAFPVGRYFAPEAGAGGRGPILEVVVALRRPDDDVPAGFAQYFLDGRGLAGELAAVDARIDRLTWIVLAVGETSLALVLFVAFLALRRAQRRLAERNERLARANLELSLAAKSSALGQITSHLVHGLQGPVAGLRAVATERAARDDPAGADGAWRDVAAYADQLQRLVAEAVQLLGEESTPLRYEVSGDDLVAAIDQRVGEEVRSRQVGWLIRGGGGWLVDNRRAGVVGLIAANLVQNAARATAPGRTVAAELVARAAEIELRVRDEGGGIPEELRARLFTPGASGRPGGTGLGLAISRLLARQVGGDLALERTGPDGTSFVLRLPRSGDAATG